MIEAVGDHVALDGTRIAFAYQYTMINIVAAAGLGFSELLLSPFGILALIIAYVWIVFPFKVVNRLDKIVAANERAADAAENALPPPPAPVVTPALHSDPDLAAHLARKAERPANYGKIPGINS